LSHDKLEAVAVPVNLSTAKEQLEAAEKGGVAEITHLLKDAESNPEMTIVKFGVQLGKKPAGSNSLKGKLYFVLKDFSPATKPPENNHVPMHCEIVSQTNTESLAKKLASNLKTSPLAPDIAEVGAVITSSGSSITVAFDQKVPFDAGSFAAVKDNVGKVTELSLSEDLYVDLDKWVKQPKLKLLDVFSGMRVDASAEVAQGILQVLQDFLESQTARGTQDPKTAELLSKVGDALNGKPQEVTIPGFDKMKQQMSAQHPELQKTYEGMQQEIEVLKSEIPVLLTDEEKKQKAVAAVNLLEQMAAADLRLSEVSCSLFSGSIRLVYAVESYPLFGTMAKTVKATGVQKSVYGEKKPEEYGILGVESEEAIQAIHKESEEAVESEEAIQAMHNAAFAAMRPSAVLGVLVLIAGWAM